jgi:hypothetical protein
MISDADLTAIINEQLNNSIGGYQSDLDNEQSEAMARYFGEKYGDEEEGLSQITTRELMENIEWTMPSLMRVFAAGERTVQFDPIGEEDEDQAQQETDYVNYVFNKENDGYMILFNWFKSSLLMKNAYVKVWVEDEETVTTETYENLTEMGLAEVLGQEGAEAIESSSYFETVVQPDPMTGQPIEMSIEMFDVKVEITVNEKKVRVANVPNEEMRVSQNTSALSLKESPFVAHSRSVTQSELLGMGFDEATVLALPGFDGDNDSTLSLAREQLDDEDSTLYSPPDESMRQIDFDECYIRADLDESGRAKLWLVSMAGSQILDKEQIDFIPFATISPVPMPHQHIGLSNADKLIDIQRSSTMLTRGIFDNLYLTNNPEKEVVEKDVNMDDLLTSRVGGLKRVRKQGSITPLIVPFTAGASMPVLDHLKETGEFRTGVGRNNMGLDAEVLAKATYGAFEGAQQQSNQQLEMYARNFAETGIRELFLMMHELIIKHYDRTIPVKLNNKFVEVSPTEWKSRANMSVVVGLGTGNRDKEIAQLWAMAERQEGHLSAGSPLVTPKNLYNTLARVVERSDLKNVNMYWTDPDSPEAKQLAQQKAQQQPQQTPEQVLAQAEMKINQEKVAMDNKELEYKQQVKLKELEQKDRELSIKEHELGLTPQIEAAKIEAARYKTDTEAETKLAIEAVKAGASVQEVINSALGEQQQHNDEQLTQVVNNLLGEMTAMRAENAESLNGVNAGFNEQLQTLASQMNRKKKIIYDEAGEPIGVEPVMD